MLDKLSIAASGHPGNELILACAYDLTPQRVLTVSHCSDRGETGGAVKCGAARLCAQELSFTRMLYTFPFSDQTAPQTHIIKILSKGTDLL